LFDWYRNGTALAPLVYSIGIKMVFDEVAAAIF
jgi:hypothetical protein